MSVVAWDGKTLAADKQATNSGLRVTTTKLRRLKDHNSDTVIAWTGDQDHGETVALWYSRGAIPADWPECQKDRDAWARLIVASPSGAFFFERQPVPIKVEDKFAAWGSGRDYALGALACGKSARQAVEVACRFDSGCGMGIDLEELR